MPHTSDFGNGSPTHSCGYGEVAGLLGLARSGSYVSGQKFIRLEATTLPAEFVTVMRTKSFRALGTVPTTLAGQGICWVPPPGRSTTCVTVIGVE